MLQLAHLGGNCPVTSRKIKQSNGPQILGTVLIETLNYNAEEVLLRLWEHTIVLVTSGTLRIATAL